MATNFYHDAMLKALLLWSANHPEWGNTIGDLLPRWFASSPGGIFAVPEVRSAYDAAGRDAFFVIAGDALGVAPLVIPLGNFREREIEFWVNYGNQPPAPAP